MDRVVCVSEGQASKVRRAGVDPSRIDVIHNAIDSSRFADPDLRYLRWLHECFRKPRRMIVGSAGRLSPEKGFEVLVEAAAKVHARDSTIGFIHFGDGPGREGMTRAIDSAGLNDVFILAGMRNDLDRFYPFFDVLALPSYTEGLPNVVLEAFAARVPVVATSVGGTPEVIEDGESGHLVPPGDAEMLAECILDVLADDDRRLAMGQRGYKRVCRTFTFDAQARDYTRLFAALLGESTVEPMNECDATRKESIAR
jgi:glycosyltransferase involved in cell wall biosynthesis